MGVIYIEARNKRELLEAEKKKVESLERRRDWWTARISIAMIPADMMTTINGGLSSTIIVTPQGVGNNVIVGATTTVFGLLCLIIKQAVLYDTNI